MAAVTLAADPLVAAGGVWAPARRRLTVGLVLTVTLVAFESLAISTVMPEVSDDLDGVGLYGWVFSGFFLGTMVGAVLAGRAADRRGTAPPFVTGLALFAVGLAVGGAAPTMAVLVAARVVQGIGAGAIPAVAYASVGRAYPPALRPRVFAVFSTAWVVPGLIGPAAATGIEHALSWRAVFLALLPLVAVAAVITLPALGRSASVVDPHAPDADADTRMRDAIVLALGAGLVVGGLSAGSPVLNAVLVIAGFPVAAWAFLRLVPPGTVRGAAGLPAAVATRGVLTFAFFGTDAFVPLAVTDGRGDPSWIAGLALTAGVLGWTSAAWIQQHRIHQDGPRRLVVLGCVLVAVGAVGALALLHGAPLALAIPWWTICGAGMGLAYAPLSVTVLGTAEPGTEGGASASLQLSDVLGVALGAGASGAFVALGEGRDWAVSTSLTPAFVVTASVALLGALLARRLPRHLDA